MALDLTFSLLVIVPDFWGLSFVGLRMQDDEVPINNQLTKLEASWCFFNLVVRPCLAREILSGWNLIFLGDPAQVVASLEQIVD